MESGNQFFLISAMGVQYVISWYDKDTNILIGEVKADPILLADFHSIFKVASEESRMYESQLIDLQQAKLLSTWLPICFDFTHYIYQLDCFRIVPEFSVQPLNDL